MQKSLPKQNSMQISHTPWLSWSVEASHCVLEAPRLWATTKSTYFSIAQDKEYWCHMKTHTGNRNVNQSTMKEALTPWPYSSSAQPSVLLGCPARVYCGKRRSTLFTTEEDGVSSPRLIPITRNFSIVMDKVRPPHGRISMDGLERLGIIWLPRSPHIHMTSAHMGTYFQKPIGLL